MGDGVVVRSITGLVNSMMGGGFEPINSTSELSDTGMLVVSLSTI
jgi:hypothetical protein